MLQQMVSHFESLITPTMEEDPKFTFTRKKSSNSQSPDESRVKKLIYNFTEIKRPHHVKSRNCVSAHASHGNNFKQRTTKAYTLPKAKSRSRGDFKSAPSSMRKQREVLNKELNGGRKIKGKEDTLVNLRQNYRRVSSIEVRKTVEMFEQLGAAKQAEPSKNKKLVSGKRVICDENLKDETKKNTTPQHENTISNDKVISSDCDLQNRKINVQEFKIINEGDDKIIFDFPQISEISKFQENQQTALLPCNLQDEKTFCNSNCLQFPEPEVCGFLQTPENLLQIDLRGNDNVITEDCNHDIKTRLVNENNRIVDKTTDFPQSPENDDISKNFKKQLQDINYEEKSQTIPIYENLPISQKLYEDSSTSRENEENYSSSTEDCSDLISSSSSIQEDQQLLVDDIENLSLNTKNIIEDDFGLNEFDEESDDNYVIEAYNDDGKELIFTIFEIKHSAALEHENDEVFNNIITNSDMIIHKNENTNSIEFLKDKDNSCESGEGDEDENIRFSATTEDSGIGDQETYSARSTLYSVNSSNSLDELTEDGDNYDDFYRDGRYDRSIENVVDNQGNVRISRAYSSLDLTKLCEVTRNHKDKLSYIVEEFITTEEQYILGLDKVVNQYKSYVEANSPNHLIGKASYLFGNIESICKQSKEFLQLLHMQPSVDGIASAIIISASMFELYPKYSKNKPTADIYLKEFDPVIKARQNELGDRLDLASYLLTPIQRLGKYILMLDNIQKELTKMTSSPDPKIRDALEIIRREMKKGNDSIAIDSIKCCTIDLALQGSFKMREKFNVLKPRKGEYMLFLFDNIIVFTQNVSKNLEEFTYIESIRMSDLSIAPLESEPLTFHLWDYSKVKKGSAERYTFVLEAKTSKTKQLWTKSIEMRLWEQLEQAKSQQKQLHGDQGKRFSKVDLPIKKARGARGDSKKAKSLHRTTSIFYDVHSINAP